jgi:membrane-associated phospholipid phosphatase
MVDPITGETIQNSEDSASNKDVDVNVAGSGDAAVEPRMASDGRQSRDGSRAATVRGTRKQTRAGGLQRLVSMRALAVLAAGFGTSLVGTTLVTKVADGVLSHQVRSFDHTILDKARGTRHTHKKLTNPVMTLLSAAGEPRVLYPVAALAAARWVTEERADDAATVALGILGSAGLNQVLKRVVHRPRPIWKLPFPRSSASGSSFPSNHATMSLATYGTIAFLLSRRRVTSPKDSEQPKQVPARGKIGSRIWVPVLLFCGLIGWSRVYQGVHNPSDVLGGWLAGGIWLLTCSAVTQS